MARFRPLFGLLTLLAACSDSVPDGARCAEAIQALAACYPDLATEARCTDATLAAFERHRLDEQSCSAIDDAGKADVFAAGGCGPGERVCGWIFCCDDWTISWYPSSQADWDIVPIIDGFVDAMPAWAAAELAQASREDLVDAVSVSFDQRVAPFGAGSEVDASVEVTRGLIDVPWDELRARLPAEDWGVRLSNRLGGEVEVYAVDAGGRAVRQLERMVLSPFTCECDTVFLNNDMTKVEVIEYRDDRATVYWRVMYSDNGSVEMDIGSVTFARHDAGATRVTFHSAHRLNLPGGVPIPGAIVKPVLEVTFRDFIDGYRRIAAGP